WRVSSKSSIESLYGTSTWTVNEVGVRAMIVAFMVPVPRVRTGNYRQGRACVYIIPRSNPHKLFLTATPHNGYSESFTALLELLDNQRFARGMSTDTREFLRQRDAIMVRRLKTELPKDDFGQDRFPKRALEALEVDYPSEEKRIHAALKRYAELRQANTGDHAEKFATDFVLMTLKKRFFSTARERAKTPAFPDNGAPTRPGVMGVSSESVPSS